MAAEGPDPEVAALEDDNPGWVFSRDEATGELVFHPGPLLRARDACQAQARINLAHENALVKWPALRLRQGTLKVVPPPR